MDSALVLLLLLASVTRAQAPRVKILTQVQIRVTAGSMPRAASRTAQLGMGPVSAFALIRRDGVGGDESHATRTDVVVIQSDTAALRYGGTAANARETTPAELRGGTIRGGTTVPLHAGDGDVIPVCVPHQTLLKSGERIAHLAFNVVAPT